MTVAMDAMAVAIHIKYLVGQNEHLTFYCRPYPYKLCSNLNSQTKRPGDHDLWPFDLESGIRVTCDVGYLCANFSLPRTLCSRVTHDVRDRL